jgi:RimJ/RimL family protein N-acetyltransferase
MYTSSFYDSVHYNVSFDSNGLSLTPMTSADADALLQLCSKQGFTYPYIHMNQKTMHVSMEDKIQDYVAYGDAVAKGECGPAMIQSIRQIGNDVLLGAAVLLPVARGDHLFKGAQDGTDWEIGYFIDRDYQGHGLARQAMRAALAFAKAHDWGVKRLWASIEPNRTASIRIAEKLGLTQCGYFRPGSPEVPYNDAAGNPAARNIYATPKGWKI